MALNLSDTATLLNNIEPKLETLRETSDFGKPYEEPAEEFTLPQKPPATVTTKSLKRKEKERNGDIFEKSLERQAKKAKLIPAEKVEKAKLIPPEKVETIVPKHPNITGLDVELALLPSEGKGKTSKEPLTFEGTSEQREQIMTPTETRRKPVPPTSPGVKERKYKTKKQKLGFVEPLKKKLK
jgi:hypothetical protein